MGTELRLSALSACWTTTGPGAQEAVDAAWPACELRNVTSSAMPTEVPARWQVLVTLEAREVSSRGMRMSPAVSPGIIASAMATPRSAMAKQISRMPVEASTRASIRPLTARKAIPTMTTGRGPRRSVSLPPNGMSTAAVSACGSRSRPVWSGE